MNILRAGAIGAALLMILVWGACSREEPAPPEPETSVTSPNVERETATGEAVQAPMDYTYEQRYEFLRDMNEELNRMEAGIDELKEEIKTKSDEAQQALQERVEQIEERQAAARERLNAMKQPTADAWDDMKKGMQDALDSVKQAYDNAAAELR